MAALQADIQFRVSSTAIGQNRSVMPVIASMFQKRTQLWHYIIILATYNRRDLSDEEPDRYLRRMLP
jgi:hypothetical protein